MKQVIIIGESNYIIFSSKEGKALTGSERAKRYREKLKQNPEKFEAQRQKQLERVKKNRKKIADLSEKEKLRQRKMWRDQKKKQKKLN